MNTLNTSIISVLLMILGITTIVLGLHNTSLIILGGFQLILGSIIYIRD